MSTEEIIQAAYFMGFEPSEESLSPEQLYGEAEEFIYKYSTNQ